MPSLPIPGASKNAWGNQINEFLRVAHNEDGSLDADVLEDVIVNGLGMPTAEEAAVAISPGDEGDIKATVDGVVANAKHRSHTAIIVAASNSPAWMKSMANYVCDGVDDQVQWQEAIDEAQASTTGPRKPAIHVLPGNYYWSSGIETGDASIICVGGATKPANVYWNGPHLTTSAVMVGNRSYWEMSGIYFRPGTAQPDTWMDCYGYGAIDVFFNLRYIQFQGGNYNIKSGVWFNFHMHDVRFDAWHEFAIQLNAGDPDVDPPTEQSLSSFVFDSFTADNNVAGTPGVTGKGFIEVNLTENSASIGTVEISGARLEFNSALPSDFGVVHIRRDAERVGQQGFALHLHDLSCFTASATNYALIRRNTTDTAIRETVLLEAVKMNAPTIFAGTWWSNVGSINLGSQPLIGRFLLGAHNVMSDSEVRHYEKFATSVVETTQMLGDTHVRYSRDASGTQIWGSGTATGDTNLYRSTADLLKTDDTLQLGTGAWNAGHLKLGAYHLWVDATGDLRIKSSTPSSDTDGTVVGSQS